MCYGCRGKITQGKICTVCRIEYITTDCGRQGIQYTTCAGLLILKALPELVGFAGERQLPNVNIGIEISINITEPYILIFDYISIDGGVR